MKLPSSKSFKRETRAPAFSLVLSLAIMAMIVVIVLSLAAFLTIELKSSSLFSKQMIARQNALMGARIAFGKIQQLAGPDRRVSAPGYFSMASAQARRTATDESLNNPHWSGIWSTIDADSPRATPTVRPFYVSYHEDLSGLNIADAFLTDTRGKDGTYTRPEVLEWLVTQVPNQQHTPETSPQTNWVTLLNYKSAGGNKKQVQVPYLGFNEGGIVSQQLGATGGFAYWVSDEGTKARVNLHDPRKEESTASGDGFYRVLAPAANNIKLVRTPDGQMPYQNFDTLNDRLGEIVTLSTMALLDFGGTPAENATSIKENFLDFTEVSSGVLASSAQGGLLSDLTAFLHSTSLNKVGKVDDDNTVNPKRPGLDGEVALMLSSEGHVNSGPYFNMLKLWYDLPLTSRIMSGGRLNVSTAYPRQVELDSDFEAGVTALKITYSAGGSQGTEGTAFGVGEYQYPALKNFHRQKNDSSENYFPISPILVEARVGFDFGYTTRTKSGDPSPYAYSMQTYLYPQVALWNPYSAPLRSNNNYAVVFHAPSILRLKIMKGGVETWVRGKGKLSHAFYSPIPDTAASWGDATSNTNVGNYGDFFHFTLKGSYEIPPGEVLVYRPKHELRDFIKYPKGMNDDDDNILIPNASRDKIGAIRFYGDYIWFKERNLPMTWSDYEKDKTVNLTLTESKISGGRYTIELEGWKSSYENSPGNGRVFDDGSTTTVTYPHVSLKLKKQINPDFWDGRRWYIQLPTLQRVTLSPGGEAPVVYNSATKSATKGDSSYDTSFWTPASQYGAGGDSFLTVGNLEQQRRGGTPPPDGFQLGYRLVRFDEEEENSIMIGGRPRFGAAGSFSPFTFNVRSPIMMRIPNAYYDENSGSTTGAGADYQTAGWLNNLATGLYLIEWDQRRLWGDSDLDPKQVDGLLKGAPFSKFGEADTEGKIIAFDFADRDYALTSLADFRHAMLSPFVWHPTYVVGNSLMDPLTGPWNLNPQLYKNGTRLWTGSSADQLQHRNKKGRGGFHKLLGGTGTNRASAMDSTDILLYDIAFEVNRTLFDGFFLSTLLKKRETRSSWDGADPLPNARLKLHQSVQPDSVAFTDAMRTTDKMYHTAATLLVNEGAFNVNSTSVEAWVAFLSSTLNVNRPLHSKGDGGTGSGAVQFSKLIRPFKDGNPTEDMSEEMGSGFRSLSEAEIRTLAEKIVEEVKFRGPFLSLSDFINRRLIGALNNSGTPASKRFNNDEAMALKGALEAAIEAAEINRPSPKVEFEVEIRDGVSSKTMDNAYVAGFPRHKSQNMAGWLTQMDILSTLAPAMTARSDTFKIRVYGDCKSPTSIQPEATAYLEVVVQRQPYFYDTSDPAQTPVTRLYDNSGKPEPIPEENTDLKPTNRQFGRKFEIVSLRWLSPNEI